MYFGNQSWIFIRRTDAEAEAPILWPPDAKSWLIGKDPDAGKDWGQEKKGMTEDEMVGWHHWLNGHEFQWTWNLWWIGRPDVLQSMESPRVRHDWVTELKWMLLRLWWKLWNILSRKIHTHSQFCSLFQGVPGTSEAYIRTPDTEPVSESEKQVEILRDVSDFYDPYIPPVNRKQSLKSIRAETFCVHTYLVTLHPNSQLCSHHLENIF